MPSIRTSDVKIRIQGTHLSCKPDTASAWYYPWIKALKYRHRTQRCCRHRPTRDAKRNAFRRRHRLLEHRNVVRDSTLMMQTSTETINVQSMGAFTTNTSNPKRSSRAVKSCRLCIETCCKCSWQYTFTEWRSSITGHTNTVWPWTEISWLFNDWFPWDRIYGRPDECTSLPPSCIASWIGTEMERDHGIFHGRGVDTSRL